MDWRRSRFTRHHNLLTGKTPITGPIVKNGRTAGKKVGRKVAGGIQYVGGRTATASSNPTYALTGLSGGIASAPAENDVAVICLAGASSITIAATLPAGWNTIVNTDTEDPSAGVNLRTVIAYKVLTASDTSVSVTVGLSTAFAVQVFRGVNTTTPLDVAAQTATAIDTGQPNPPAITPVTSGAWVVAAGGSHGRFTSVAFTSPDLLAFNSIVNAADSFDPVVGMGYLTAGGGAVDPAQYGGGADVNQVQCSVSMATIALRPA